MVVASVIGLVLIIFVAYLFLSKGIDDYTKKSDLELIQLLGLHKNNVSAASKTGHARHQVALERMSHLTAEMKKRGLIKQETTIEDPVLQRTLESVAQKQFSRSIKDIQTAAAGNDAQALYQMAMIFHISKETETSLKYMTKSAEAGYVDAQYALGWAYLQGTVKTGTEDKAMGALKWFKIASLQGHTDAGKALDVARKSVAEIDIKRAFEEADRWLSIYSVKKSLVPL